MGQRQVPWGTPDRTLAVLDEVPSITTLYGVGLCSVRKLWIQLWTGPQTPKWVSFASSFLWDTTSKALGEVQDVYVDFGVVVIVVGQVSGGGKEFGDT